MEGESQLGGRLWLGGHREGSGGTLRSPLALSAALLPEPGAQGRKFSSSRGLGAWNRENMLAEFLPVCAGPTWKQLGLPTLTTQKEPTQREGDRVGHRMTERQTSRAPLGLRELGWGDRGREGRGWGGETSHRAGQQVAQTRSPETQFFCPATPMETPEPGAPRHPLPGGPAVPGGGRGMVRLCSAARQIQR